MNVVIVCSSVEPGRDGVGDYSVRLAAALIAQGHKALVIAECDVAVIAQLPVHGDYEGVPTVRLPASASNEERGRWLADELADFSPDWVLLQFVCWGFADRGILDPPPTALIAALAGRRVAVYCHELWLGLPRGASPRHRWWGFRQRRSILRFLALLQPAVVLTSNPAYCDVLRLYGWSARVVPLLSNIPVHAGATEKVRVLLEKQAGRSLWNARGDVLMLAVFGSVYPEWKPEAALRWLHAEAKRRNRRVVLVCAGRPSTKGEKVLARLAKNAEIGVTFVRLGEVSPEIVSGLLHEADLGLPATEWLVLGKSGVAAAMIAHGLPMLVVRHAQSFRELPGLSVTHPPLMHRFDPTAPPDFDRMVGARGPARDTSPEITRQLVDVLAHTPTSASLCNACMEQLPAPHRAIPR